MTPQMAERDSLMARADPHLKRLTLGMHFPSYQATWTGAEAADFLGLLEELCDFLDTGAPRVIDAAWARRREELGLPARRGAFLAESRARIRRDGGYAGLLEPNMALLRRASAPDMLCGWDAPGCRVMHATVLELIDKVTSDLAAIVAAAGRAGHREAQKFSEQN